MVTNSGILAANAAGLLVKTMMCIGELRCRQKRLIFGYLLRRVLYNSGVRAAHTNTILAVLVAWALVTFSVSFLPNNVLAVDYFSSVFYSVVFRELGPITTGIVLISRSAVAVTSELSHARLTGEFEVMAANRMNPKLVYFLPILVAFPLSLVLMFVWFDLICIVAIYVFVSLFESTSTTPDIFGFVSGVASRIGIIDAITILLKALAGGLIIGVVSLQFSLKVKDRYTDVSRAISNSATVQLMLLFSLNFLISALSYR